MSEAQLPSNDFAARLQARIAVLEQQNAALQQEQVQLRQSEARYRQVIENAPMSIAFISAGGCPLEGNRAFEQMYGVTIAQLRQENFNIFTDPQLAENGTLLYIQRALAGETVIEPASYYDAGQTVKGGIFLRGQRYYFPIRDGLGRVQEVVEICPDVTALYEAQQGLLQAEQERVAELAKVNEELLQREREQAAKERFAQLAIANTVLKKTLDVLASEPDLDRSLGHVLQVTTEHLGSDSAALWLFNPDSDTFSLHLVYLHGGVIAATPETAHLLTNQWIRERDLSRDLTLKRHIHDRVPVIYDLDNCPDITPPQRQFMQRLGVKTLLGVPLLLGSAIVGSFTVRFTEQRSFGAEDLELIQALAHQATLAIQLMKLADEARQTALLIERNRMAGEIHDTLAQAFTGISIQVGMAQKLITSSPTGVQQILDRVLTLAQTGLAEARRSVWELHPTADEYADLTYKLTVCIEQLTSGLPIQAEVSIVGTPCLVPAIVGQNLLRIVQEAVNNTIKHAQATQLRVRLTCFPEAITLRVWDNGHGFEPHIENGGFGLIGMSDRAARLNGQFILCSQPGYGTEIRVRVPR